MRHVSRRERHSGQFGTPEPGPPCEESRSMHGPSRSGRPLLHVRLTPVLGRVQNRGAGARLSTRSAASSGVATAGGEPASGLRAVSFMKATETVPTRAAAIA